MTRIILVTGGRKYQDRPFVWRMLTGVHATTPIDILVHGDAQGADTHANDWAKEYGVQRCIMPACWGKLDPSIAGFRRNRLMAELRPELVIAFPGGTGTASMVRIARDMKLNILDLRNGPIRNPVEP